MTAAAISRTVWLAWWLIYFSTVSVGGVAHSIIIIIIIEKRLMTIHIVGRYNYRPVD